MRIGYYRLLQNIYEFALVQELNIDIIRMYKIESWKFVCVYTNMICYNFHRTFLSILWNTSLKVTFVLLVWINHQNLEAAPRSNPWRSHRVVHDCRVILVDIIKHVTKIDIDFYLLARQNKLKGEIVFSVV